MTETEPLGWGPVRIQDAEAGATTADVELTQLPELREGEVAFAIPKLQQLFGRVFGTRAGGSAAWALAAGPAVLAMFILTQLIGTLDEDTEKAEMATTAWTLFVICFTFALAVLGAPLPSLARALAPDTGALALLAGENPVVSTDDSRLLRRYYIGTTALSVWWILSNMPNFWVQFVFKAGLTSDCGIKADMADVPCWYEWFVQLLGNFLCGHFVFPLIWSAWWCTMKMGSALARQRVMRVIASAKKIDPNDIEAWKVHFADALALNGAMARLSRGWSTGLVGLTATSAFMFTSALIIFVNKPKNHTGAAVSMFILAGFPLLLWNDVTQTSSWCDKLMVKLNDSGIKFGEKCRVLIDWLETRLRRLHQSQGLGLVKFGMVLDQRVLDALAVAIGGALITIITWVLALSDNTAVLGAGTEACALPQSYVQGIKGMMIDRNASCSYNNVSSVLRLKTDDHDASRLPLFHLRPPASCRTCKIADPDFPFYDAKHRMYHLFFRYFGAARKTPVIGHAASRDMVRWTRLPVAITNTTWYDSVSIWTGSATVVNGTPYLTYPGHCVPNVGGCGASGFDFSQVVPADAADPLYKVWRKLETTPIVNDTFDDPSTAWRAERLGEWRFIGNSRKDRTSLAQSPIFASSTLDFRGPWRRVGLTNLSWGECPSLYPLPLPPGVTAAAAKAAGWPSHVHKRSRAAHNCSDECSGDTVQLGNWYDGATKGEVGTWSAAKGFERQFEELQIIDAGNRYASKDFLASAKQRRINYGWIHVPGGGQSLPRVQTFEPATKQLLNAPLPEISSLRTSSKPLASLGFQWLNSSQVPLGTPAAIIAAGANASDVTIDIYLPCAADYRRSASAAGSAAGGGPGRVGVRVMADAKGKGGVLAFFELQPLSNGWNVTVGFDPPCFACTANPTGGAPHAQQLQLLSTEQRLSLRVLSDRQVVEAYWMGGRVAMTTGGAADDGDFGLPGEPFAPRGAVFAESAGLEIEVLDAALWPMGGIWATEAEVLAQKHDVDASSGHADAGAGSPSCATTPNGTLFSLDASDPQLKFLAAADAAACCALCAAQERNACATWSFTEHWGHTATPCHLSARAPLKRHKDAKSAGGAAPVPPPSPVVGRYTVDASNSGHRQVMEGIGFEIQADSIGSGTDPTVNNSVISGVPHDLTKAERARFYSDMLKGFRTCRLALGLYVRGMDAEGKHFLPRWPTQLEELAEMQNQSQITGFDVEYWSPATYWKGPKQLLTCSGGGKALRWSSNNASFVKAFSDAMAQDVLTLRSAGLNIKWWGLQNEPQNCPEYAGLRYNDSSYRDVFVATAPKIKAVAAGVRIEAGSSNGCASPAKGVFDDPVASALVDSWTFHTGGKLAATAMKNFSCGDGKSVWVNEWEYFHFNLGATDTVNIAASIINWFVFSDAPKFTWLHALKPTYNVEAVGFGLGFWRPYDDDVNRTIHKGHWRYNNVTWNALGGFPRHMPWNSIRLNVTEEMVYTEQRIMAFATPALGDGGPLHKTTPAGKVGLVLTNAASVSFTARVTLKSAADSKAVGPFRGHRYTIGEFGTALGQRSVDGAGVLTVVLPPFAIEFWTEGV